MSSHVSEGFLLEGELEVEVLERRWAPGADGPLEALQQEREDAGLSEEERNSNH